MRALSRRLLYAFRAKPDRDAETPARQDYAEWTRRYSTIGPAERKRLVRWQGRLADKPLVSVVIDADGAGEGDVEASLSSLRAQTYDRWEAIICSGAGPVGMEIGDGRVRFASDTISRAPAQLPTETRGAIVTLLVAGDRLSPAALTAVAVAFSDRPQLVALYTDEDRIGEDGRRGAHWFKGEWSPDLGLAQAYMLRLGALRREVLEAASGEPEGMAARTTPGLFYAAWLTLAAQRNAAVARLPFVLYHRASSAPDAEPPEFASIVRQTRLEVRKMEIGGWRRVVRPIPSPAPRISLCVPTRDRVQLLAGCIEGLRHATDWPDIEIIVVDNGSEEAETREYLADLATDERVRVLRDEGEFNFSRLNNLGASVATGALFGLVNNDLAVQDPGWLRELASHAVRPEVGAAGALLHYGDDTVQHAGVVLGIGGYASHIHKRLPAGNAGYHGRASLTQDVSAVTAACLLTRLDVYRQFGGLDEAELPVAYNDVDFCLRLRQAGYRIIFAPHARLYHLESASRGLDRSGARRDRLEHDKATLLRRWGRTLAEDPFYSPNLSDKAVDCRLAFPPRVRPFWAEP